MIEPHAFGQPTTEWSQGDEHVSDETKVDEVERNRLIVRR